MDKDVSFDQLNAMTRRVYHDLSAPIRRITAFSQFLQEDYRQVLDGEGQQLLNSILNNALHAKAILASLNELAQISLEQNFDNKLDLKVVCEEAVSFLKSQGLIGHIQLNVGALPCIRGSIEQWKKVFVELIKNAAEHHQEGDIPVINISFEATTDGGCMSVEDNGVGVESINIQTMTDILSSSSRDGDSARLGMGLAFVDRIVANHGAMLSFAASDQGGLAVKISMPHDIMIQF